MAAENPRYLSGPELDEIVSALHGPNSDERKIAEERLQDWKNNTIPNMLLHVPSILQSAQKLETKLFVLQAYEEQINNRWNVLPIDEQSSIKSYMANCFFNLPHEEASNSPDYVKVHNTILFQILKHDLVARWRERDIILNLIAAARASEKLCVNCMDILKLLRQEVLEYSTNTGGMTDQLNIGLDMSLRSYTDLIFELCEHSLQQNHQESEVIPATFSTLHAFLSWFHLDQINRLVDILVHLLPAHAYQNFTIQCFTEVVIVALTSNVSPHNAVRVKIYTAVIEWLQSTGHLYLELEPTNQDIVETIENLALFLTSFYKSSHCMIEPSHAIGFEYLIKISYVDDAQVFKVCLDFWSFFASEPDIFAPKRPVSFLAVVVDGPATGLKLSQAREIFLSIMAKLRLVMVYRLAKPAEELRVVEDGWNLVDHETLVDNDVAVQDNKVMSETLANLLQLIDKQLDDNDSRRI